MESRNDWERFLQETVRTYGAPALASRGDGRGADVLVHVENARCGDSVEIRRLTNGSIKVIGNGCSICRASAALAEMTIADRETGLAGIKDLATGMITAIEGRSALEPFVDDPEHAQRLRAFFVLADHPGRQRCATLAWEAIREACRVDSA